MILEFTVGNFLSFNEKRTLSFEAKGISELKSNLINANNHKLLRSAVVYGANSSGKSNLIKAFETMKLIVLTSVKLNDGDKLDCNPFLLAYDSKEQPTFFEMSFFIKDKKYRYGFEYNQIEIVHEWLFEGAGVKKEKTLFLRTKDGIAVTDKFEEGKGKEGSTNNNRLFISLVAQLNGTISRKTIDWFDNGYNVLSSVDYDDYKGYTVRMLHERLDGYNESLTLFKVLKLGFNDLETTESEFNEKDIPTEISKSIKSKIIKKLEGKTLIKLKARHNKFDKKGNIIDSISWDR